METYRERFFDFIKLKDPTEPEIPKHLEMQNYFTAPFKLSHKEKYVHLHVHAYTCTNVHTYAYSQALESSLLKTGSLKAFMASKLMTCFCGM